MQSPRNMYLTLSSGHFIKIITIIRINFSRNSKDTYYKSHPESSSKGTEFYHKITSYTVYFSVTFNQTLIGFQTILSIRLNSASLKWERPNTSGCKYIDIDI